MSSRSGVTQLLQDWGNGDTSALDKLVPLIYGELRCLARRFLCAERLGHTVQPTALVHEAYLRLTGQRGVQWQNRAHFFAISARLMRRILTDYARNRNAFKRGGDKRKLPLEEVEVANQWIEAKDVDVVALDDALKGLEALNPRQTRIVDLRFFGGFTIEEIAQILQISADTVKRDLRIAKAWLRREISEAGL